MALLTVDAVREAVHKTKSERSLRYYLEHVCWPVIEPQTEFRGGWHIDAMCEHAAALVDNQIRNLLITVPPRHTKSIIASVAMPSWGWVKYPELRFLYASFSSDLSLEHAVLSRRVIQSKRYQRYWGENVQLMGDQNIKSFYENSKRGYRISSSVGGTVIGRGGDILGLDDPHNLQDIDSDIARVEVIRFYQHVWSGRFNDPKTGRRLVIMQRGHETDLAAHIIENAPEAWCHLNLPTEYEPTPWVEVKGNVAILKGNVATEEERLAFEIRQDQLPPDIIVRNEIRINPLGWKDPRTQQGELLNPDRFGPDEIANAKRDLGPTGYATQHQQRPMPLSGGMFQRAKVQILRPEELPRLRFAECRGWDQAATVPTPGMDPDFTVGAKLRRYTSGIYVVMHVVRDQFGPEDGDKVLFQTSLSDGKMCKVREEQEGGSSGKKVIAAHERLLERFDYEGFPKSVNKVVYAKPFAVRWDAGEVFLLQADWNQDFIDEVCLSATSAIMTPDGERAIQDMRVGDLVMTRAGWRRVLVAKQTKKAATVCEIRMSNGRSLVATLNHPILVQGCGFIPAGRLKIGDVLSRCIAESPSLPMRGGATFEHASTVSRLDSIATSGSVKWDRFRRGITSIIETVMDSTMPARIWSACRRLHISNSIPGRQSWPFAWSAAATTGRLNEADLRRARDDVRAWRNFARGTSISMSGTASGVGRPSSRQPRAPRIAADVVVEATRMLFDAQPVYNLEVDGVHEFVAEGVVVHNCLFPQGRHDDQVDACATAFHELAAHPVSQLTAAEILSIGSRDEDARSAYVRKQF